MKFLKLLTETAPKQNGYLFEIISHKLFILYDFPIRKYHNIDHIDSCIDEFNCMPKLIYSKDDQIKILYALYYHDCFYDPKCNVNEIVSAQIAYVDLIALGFDEDFAEEIQNIILCTMHNKICDKLTEQTVMDIDLAILGKEKNVFLNYEADIEVEYNFIPKRDYITGRISALKKFLDRGYIYQTSYFKDLYEKKALENINFLLKFIK